MHDFSHIAAFPGILMFAFFAFVLFMPLMAFAALTLFGKAWAPCGAINMSWMYPAKAVQGMHLRQHDQRTTGETGNSAFDSYRAETLARLEEEAKDFAAFRDRLRKARDRERFGRFIDEMKKTSRT